jgi:hypothetical protein
MNNFLKSSTIIPGEYSWPILAGDVGSKGRRMSGRDARQKKDADQEATNRSLNDIFVDIFLPQLLQIEGDTRKGVREGLKVGCC